MTVVGGLASFRGGVVGVAGDGAVKPSVVEPLDGGHGRELDIVETPPRSLPVDELPLVERDCPTNGVSSWASIVVCLVLVGGQLSIGKSRPSKVSANALRAGFHRFIHREAPLPVGSRLRTTR